MSRALWKGNIAFGLVSIPVEMQSAVKEKKISFHMVTPDGKCRLRQKLYCPTSGKEYNFSQAAKGYEIAPDEVLVVDKEELEALKPDSGHTIDIKEFVDISEVDPIYYSRSYVLIPQERSEKAYSLLREAIVDSRKVGIGKAIIREKQYFGVLREFDKSLLFSTLHYKDEVMSTAEIEDVEFEKLSAPDKKELALALKLIDSMEGKFNPDEYVDTYQEELKEFLDKKAKGKTVKVHKKAKEKETKGKIIDLVDKLKSSLKSTEGSKSKSRAKHHKKAA